MPILNVQIGPCDKALSELLNGGYYSKKAILTDSNTHTFCLPLLMHFLEGFEQITISAGEEHKDLSSCETIWKALSVNNFDRKSLLICLGGGMIGDLGGFCASVYKRGIPFILIPTTLLAQADACIGGKTGIDFTYFKNQIGSFSEPDKILIDIRFLKTLPEREFRSGLAEIIKHKLLSDPYSLQLFDGFSPENNLEIEEYVKASVDFKIRVTKEDPLDRGKRKILNFGHTVGHALETLYLKRQLPILHGEAVAAGLICESYVSYLNEGITLEEIEKIKKIVSKACLLPNIDPIDVPLIWQCMLQDKKNNRGSVSGVILRNIGDPLTDVYFTKEHVEESIRYYNL